MAVTEDFTVARIEARLDPKPWPFADERRGEIDLHWQKLISANPALWNGRVLVQHCWSAEAGVYRAGYMPVDYASFLAWRDFGWPGPPVRNGFAMAVLRGSDGGFLLGRMSASTANAGMVYFPGGTPDLSDVTTDGLVDLEASLRRELEEETGVSRADYALAESWRVVVEGSRVAFLREARLGLPSADAHVLLRARLPTLADRELDDIVLVRGRADIDRQRMPTFVVHYLESMLG